MAGLGIAGAIAATVKNVFRKKWTYEFPEVIRPRPPRYRASFALLHDENGEESCVACLLCEKVCPSQVIHIKAGPKKESPFSGKKRQYAEDFTLDLSACLQCELCVQVCPQDAIVMVNRPEVPTDSREALQLTMAKLYENEKGVPVAWANASRLLEMQEPPKPPAAAPSAATVPTNGHSATPPKAVATPVQTERSPGADPSPPTAQQTPSAPLGLKEGGR